jgi:hypothetical protein
MDNTKLMILILAVTELVSIGVAAYLWIMFARVAEDAEFARRTAVEYTRETGKLRDAVKRLTKEKPESDYPTGDYCQKCKAVVATVDDTRFCQHDLPCKNFKRKVSLLDALNGNTGIRDKEGEDGQ